MIVIRCVQLIVLLALALPASVRSPAAKGVSWIGQYFIQREDCLPYIGDQIKGNWDECEERNSSLMSQLRQDSLLSRYYDETDRPDYDPGEAPPYDTTAGLFEGSRDTLQATTEALMRTHMSDAAEGSVTSTGAIINRVRIAGETTYKIQDQATHVLDDLLGYRATAPDYSGRGQWKPAAGHQSRPSKYLEFGASNRISGSLPLSGWWENLFGVASDVRGLADHDAFLRRTFDNLQVAVAREGAEATERTRSEARSRRMEALRSQRYWQGIGSIIGNAYGNVPYPTGTIYDCRNGAGGPENAAC